MERKTSITISRKNRDPTKSQTYNGNNMEGYGTGRREVKKLKVKGYARLAMHNY